MSLLHEEPYVARYNEGIEQAFNTAWDILQQRGTEYNNGAIDRPDYALYGQISLVSLLWVKLLRLVSILQSPVGDTCGPAEDCLIDLINYAAMLYAYRFMQQCHGSEATNNA